jgi:hypothetical protein
MTGCASLRKKFTRKPKEAKTGDKFIPVLQPVEYAKIVETPVQAYRDHYGMVRVYFRSLFDVMGTREGGAKRELYIISELLARFDAMTELLSDPKKAEAKVIHGRVADVLKQYDKSESMLRYDLMRSAMLKIERDIYRGFKPEVVTRVLVSSGAGTAAGQ